MRETATLRGADHLHVRLNYLSPALSVAFLTGVMLITFMTTYFLYDDNTLSICESLGYDCGVATTKDIPTISFTFVPASNWGIRSARRPRHHTRGARTDLYYRPFLL